jgi:hypothetical protein
MKFPHKVGRRFVFAMVFFFGLSAGIATAFPHGALAERVLSQAAAAMSGFGGRLSWSSDGNEARNVRLSWGTVEATADRVNVSVEMFSSLFSGGIVLRVHPDNIRVKGAAGLPIQPGTDIRLTVRGKAMDAVLLFPDGKTAPITGVRSILGSSGKEKPL